MFQIEAGDQLLATQVKGFLCNFDEFFVMLCDFLDLDFEFGVHFFRGHHTHGVRSIGPVLARHVCDDADEFAKDLRAGFLDEGHQFFDFLFFRPVDHHFVAFLHKKVQLFSQLAVVQQRVIDLNEAIVLILSFLVLSEELSDVFVALEVFGLEFFKPFFGLFHTDRLHG